MKYYYKRIEAIAFFMGIWVILNENFRERTLWVGLVISMGTLFITNKLLDIDYAEVFYEPPYALFKYFLTLLIEIYKASFDMLKRIFTGNIHPIFVEYESRFTGELPLVLLSNSITLTPGTAVAQRCGSKLTILSADPDPQSARDGAAGLEKSLEKLDGGD